MTLCNEMAGANGMAMFNGKTVYNGKAVHITEGQNLSYVGVPGLKQFDSDEDNDDDDDKGDGRKENEKQAKKKVPESESNSVTVHRSPTEPTTALVRFRPKLTELQKRLRSKHALQFVVEYDVQRTQKGGEIQVLDGYFVHFVAPENLPAMPKHVVFVLDTSGSMGGVKIRQTKSAMATILKELRAHDHMSVLSFADDVTEWIIAKEVNAANTKEAMDVVEALEPKGGTNLNAALLSALSVVQRVSSSDSVSKSLSDSQHLVLFLTDGHATAGETSNAAIVGNVLAVNRDIGASIFSLAFGRHADFDLLKVLSLQNYGFARKIYVAADASLQLLGFYKEVSSPILRDVNFSYADAAVVSKSLTATNFRTYYLGSEMVVAGKVSEEGESDRSDLIEYRIDATQADSRKYHVDGANSNMSPKTHYYPVALTETVFDVSPQVRAGAVNFLERLWAYLTIQNLLDRIAKGEVTSCEDASSASSVASKGRSKRTVPSVNKKSGKDVLQSKANAIGGAPTDDEDYSSDELEGSGEGIEDDERSDEELDEEMADEEEQDESVEDIMDAIGDSDNLRMCNNVERALFLSLKYEFVTPLTSLVVVKPDSAADRPNYGEADGFNDIVRFSHGVSVKPSLVIAILILGAAVVQARVWKNVFI